MGSIAPFVLALQIAGVCLAAQPIEIVFDFKTPPEPAVINVMKSEIREILLPAELDLTFQRLGDTASLLSFRKIVLVRFQGVCQSGWSVDPIQLTQPALLNYPALGRTEMSDGRVMPFVHIFCNEVRAFVPSVSRTPQQKMYGRALGRVVAHELYHALLSTVEHAHSGIAGAVQSARDLTREKLTLDSASIERLREMWGGLGKP
jgi:hypothetical protein